MTWAALAAVTFAFSLVPNVGIDNMIVSIR